ncbi:DUF5336 domain-containing protein [Streptomyces sp. NPDC054940]
MSTADITRRLLADRTGRTTARVRTRALSDADEITAAAQNEYTAYLALRAPAERASRHPPTDHGTLLPALTVLTPVVAATSAAIALLLGYVLQLVGTPGVLPASLVTAGWVLTLIAALSTLVALVALLRTAVRERGGPPPAQQLEQARQSWQQALLDRGMIPRLRRYVDEELPLGTAETDPPPTSTPQHFSALLKAEARDMKDGERRTESAERSEAGSERSSTPQRPRR